MQELWQQEMPRLFKSWMDQRLQLGCLMEFVEAWDVFEAACKDSVETNQPWGQAGTRVHLAEAELKRIRANIGKAVSRPARRGWLKPLRPE